MIYALVKRVLEDVYDLFHFIFMLCHRMRKNFMNRRKTKKEVIIVGHANREANVSFLKRIKLRRADFVKMRLKSSEDIVDVEQNAGQKELLEETNDGPLFEFVN